MQRTVITPQNKFLETILKHSSYSDTNFVIGNAKLEKHPIVYGSENFSKELGYHRADIMQKNCMCYFLFGKMTDKDTVTDIEASIRKKTSIIKEIILYKANRKPVWYLLHVNPVKDDGDDIILFLITFRNISHLKEPIEEETKKGWGKIIKKKLVSTDNKQNTKSVFLSLAKKPDNKSKQISQLMSVLSDFKPQYSWQTVTTPKYIIIHYSTFKSTWDWIILVFTLYTAVVVPFVVSFRYTGLGLIIFNTLVDCLFITDVVINFRTTYVNKEGEIVSQPKDIRKNYLKGWFTIDFFAAIPYGLFNFYKGSAWMSEAIGGIKIIRLMRLGRIARRLDRYLEYGATTLILWLLVYCLCAHWMACIWYLIGYRYDTPKKSWGWLHQLSAVTEQPYVYINGTLEEESGPTIASAYMSSLYYCMSSLTTCGFGNIAPTTTAEKLFGCVTMLLGCVLYAFIFGQVTAIIQQFQKASSFYHEKVRQMKEFIKIYSIPTAIGFRLTDYFSSTWSQNKGIDVEQIMKLCPRDLQADLCIHIHRKVLETHIAFQGAPPSTLRLIARYFWTMRTAPGEVVICNGEFIECLYFVGNGSLEIKDNDQILGILGPVDYFGASIDTNTTRERAMYVVSALTYCDLHCIDRSAFKEVMQLYPEFYEQFSEKLVMAFPLTMKIKAYVGRGSNIEMNETKITMVEEINHKRTILEDSSSFDPHSSGPKPGFTKRMTPRAKPIVYDEYDTIEDQSVEALSGIGDLKGEVRTEIERLNAKMGIVEEQITLILKLLQKGEPHTRSQVNLKLAELQKYATETGIETDTVGGGENSDSVVSESKQKAAYKTNGQKEKNKITNKENYKETEAKKNSKNVFDDMVAPAVELRAPKLKKKESEVRKEKKSSSNEKENANGIRQKPEIKSSHYGKQDNTEESSI